MTAQYCTRCVGHGMCLDLLVTPILMYFSKKVCLVGAKVTAIDGLRSSQTRNKTIMRIHFDCSLITHSYTYINYIHLKLWTYPKC